MTFEIHEYASLVPMATTEEQAALNRDIQKNGLREPVVLWKGKIVDGRCRQIACNFAGEKIRSRDLDDDLDDTAVKSFVKSINTRRNLTQTQKVIAACKEKQGSSLGSRELSDSWGIGYATLNNAIYISRQAPEFIEPLFNGESVTIKDKNNHPVTSSKINAIYAYLKREEQSVKEDKFHEWKENSFIKTQAGKDWHQKFKSRNPKINEMKEVVMALAELANYKFQEKETADIRYNSETGEVQ